MTWVLRHFGITTLSSYRIIPLVTVSLPLCCLYSLHVSPHGSFSSRFLTSCWYSGSDFAAAFSLATVMALGCPGESIPVAICRCAVTSSFSSLSMLLSSRLTSGSSMGLSLDICFLMFRAPIMSPIIILGPLFSFP